MARTPRRSPPPLTQRDRVIEVLTLAWAMMTISISRSLGGTGDPGLDDAERFRASVDWLLTRRSLRAEGEARQVPSRHSEEQTGTPIGTSRVPAIRRS